MGTNIAGTGCFAGACYMQLSANSTGPTAACSELSQRLAGLRLAKHPCRLDVATVRAAPSPPPADIAALFDIASDGALDPVLRPDSEKQALLRCARQHGGLPSPPALHAGLFSDLCVCMHGAFRDAVGGGSFRTLRVVRVRHDLPYCPSTPPRPFTPPPDPRMCPRGCTPPSRFPHLFLITLCTPTTTSSAPAPYQEPWCRRVRPHHR